MNTRLTARQPRRVLPSLRAVAIAALLGLAGCSSDSTTTAGTIMPPPSPTPSPSSYTLGVTVAGAGAVVSSPVGISCGLTCSAAFVDGANVTLTAQPAAGHDFSGWGGACTGGGGCALAMTANRAVTANFSPAPAPAPDPAPAPTPDPTPAPGGSLTVGYNHATRSVTSSWAILDLASPPDDNYPVWVSGAGYPNLVRAATHERVTTGGFFGRGFSRFRPGYFNDGNRGEHYAGIGQIHGFNNVGDSSRMVVGQLIRFGATFFTNQADNANMKLLIMINDSGSRPMIIPKNNVTRVLAACNGTTCNTTNNVNSIDYFNDGNHLPNMNAYLGQWLWVELAYNSNASFTRVRTWSADGTLQGAETIAPWAAPGRTTTMDIIGFVNSIPNPDAQSYYDLERVEFRVGTDANITPPAGFPGSAR